MSKEIDQAVNDYLKSINVEYSVLYLGEIPKKWGDDKEISMDQWITKFKKGNVTIQEMYFTGLGLRKVTSKYGLRDDRRNYPKNSIGYEQWVNEYMMPVKPEAEEVLYSMFMDAEAMHESFNGWCDNFGYSSDSIEALKIYQDCCEIGKKLCQVFTKEELSVLREMLQDY